MRSKVKAIQRSWMYTTHCTMLIHSCAKHSITMSKDKKAVARTQSGMPMPTQTEETTKTYKVDLKVKGQCWIGIMNVRNTSSHDDKRVCQIWEANVKSKMFLPATKICQKPCKFDLEVKGQRCIGITNIHIVSWYFYVPIMVSQSQTKKNYGPDTNLHRQTDRQTDRQSDSYIYPPPRTSFTGGIMKVVNDVLSPSSGRWIKQF